MVEGKKTHPEIYALLQPLFIIHGRKDKLLHSASMLLAYTLLLHRVTSRNKLFRSHVTVQLLNESDCSRLSSPAMA